MEYREWDRDTTEYQSEDMGTILSHTRKFGVEIECLGSENDAYRAIHQIPYAVGVADDGSIRGKGYGLEFQTPIASGDKGEALIRDVCDILQRNSFKVNESTGLHVHIDMHDFLPKNEADTENEDYRALYDLKSVLMFYIAFDDVLLSFLPINRRGNEFCRALHSYFSLDEINQAPSHEALEEMWYRVRKEHVPREKRHLKHSSRYRGLNFHSFFRDGHVEIRYHSGTLNASKILYWIELHNAILTYARLCDTNYLMERAGEIRLDRKAQTLYELLQLSPDAIAYFKARQKKFSTTQTEVAILKNVNVPASCVA